MLTVSTHSKVLDVHVQLLDLLGILLPHVVADHRQVQVDQLAREPRELVVDAHGVVPARRRLVRVLRALPPLVRVNYLPVRVPHRETALTIATFQHLQIRKFTNVTLSITIIIETILQQPCN